MTSLRQWPQPEQVRKAMARSGAALLAALLWLAACDDSAVSFPQPEPMRSPAEQLVRVSMALRGRRPSVDDLKQVEADPAALEELVDAYLEDPGFGETIRDLHNEALLIRTDYWLYPAGFRPMGALSDWQTYAINRSLQDAPLRLIEHVVTHDRPYTEILTADYLLANHAVATVWGSLPYDPEGAEWQLTTWDDGRPSAGVLTDPMLFTRHQSTPTNANRGRAAFVAKAFLCFDYLSLNADIGAGATLADQEQVDDALVHDPTCVNCHKTLDPLAAFFQHHYPIYLPADLEEYPFWAAYLPGIFEALEVSFPPPALFGKPGEGIEDLGTLMAQDALFAHCTARRFYAYLHQIPLTEVPISKEARFRDVLVDSGMNAKQMMRAMVLDADFLNPPDGGAQLLKARPEQLDTLVRDLTGFVWATDLKDHGFGEVPLMRDTFVGYTVLAGGLDGQYVTQPSHAFTPTSELVLRDLAAAAASAVVEADLAQTDPSQRRLLKLVEEHTRDEAMVRAQLAWLHARLYGELVEADDERVSESAQLFFDALALDRGAASGGTVDGEADGGARRAWTLTLSAMLRDHRVVAY